MKKTILTMCHYCSSENHHNSLFVKRVRVTVEEEEDLEDEFITYMALECGGCKMISFLTRTKNPYSIPGEAPHIVKHFSHHMDEEGDDFTFLRDKDYESLPTKIQNLYDEVTSAFEEGLQVMAGVGLRTLVEAVCNHQQITGRNLQEKIRTLHVTGLISAAELPILDKLRLIGNQSTHEMKAFSIEKLSYALDIINHILISIYVLPKINRRLKI